MDRLSGLPDYKPVPDIKIKGLRVSTDNSQSPNVIYAVRRKSDPSFAPAQTLVGYIDLSQLSSGSLKRIVPLGTSPSELFTVLFVGQMEVLSTVERETRKFASSAKSDANAMAAVGFIGAENFIVPLISAAISSGISAAAKLRQASKQTREVVSKDDTGRWYFFNLEVPLDDEGKFSLKIPDEALLPPTGDTEYGDIHYKLCLVSKSQRLIGEVYNIRLDGHFDSDGTLYKAPSATPAKDVLPGIVRATAAVEHDRLVLLCPPELDIFTVIGTQMVNVNFSPVDSSDAKLKLLTNAFCDVKAMFVHRISVKGGKHSSDFEFKPVKTKGSLHSLATSGTSVPIILKLEMCPYNLSFQRFSGPFYLTEDPSNPTRTICFLDPPPTASNMKPTNAAASTSERSLLPSYSGEQERYLMSSEWFVRVKIEMTAASKADLSNIQKASNGSAHEIVLDVPFGVTILRAKQEHVLPAYS
ncbi:hypothetical protein BJ742DRAFT_116388 [Cladochytrium replicatum]|nr:hypothetical protein BJ742DRAFT_116388 [Cladochytrium replicatum]